MPELLLLPCRILFAGVDLLLSSAKMMLFVEDIKTMSMSIEIMVPVRSRVVDELPLSGTCLIL